LQAGDGAGEAAGVDEGKVGQVGGDVEGQAVQGNPAAKFNTHGTDLGGTCGIERPRGRGVERVDPDAGGSRVAVADEVEAGDGVDDDLFKQAHVGVEVEVVVIEGNDGIGHELAGAMESDVAAAVGFNDFDAAEFDELGGDEEVVGRAGVATNGDDGGMLNEEEETGVGGGSEHLVVEFKLAVPGLAVLQQANVDDFR
jgi:hypothetical protein